jgi:hypothetical protein
MTSSPTIPSRSRWYLGALLSLVCSLTPTVAPTADNLNRDELKNLAARVIPQARIDFVMFDKIETKYITPNIQASSASMLVGQVLQYRWTQTPDPLFSARDFFAPRIKATYLKSNEQILSPRYRNRRCRDTWTYVDEVITDKQRDGELRSVCSEDAFDGSGRTANDVTTSRITSAPDIETDTIIGTYKGTFPVSSGLFTENLETTVKSGTVLTFNGPPGKMYWVDLKLSLESGALNEITRTLQFTKPIACKGIRIGLAKTDRNCVARILIEPSKDPTLPNMQTIDVTPPLIAGKIIRYEVSVAAGPQEK